MIRSPDREVSSARKSQPCWARRNGSSTLGAVTLAWNQAVHQLLRVFCHLTGLETPLAEAIFFSPQSDSVQRNLIKRVATAVGLAERDQKTLDKLFKRLSR
ncbi:hypothetical protein ACFYE9_16425 [Rhizobium leguminosarum]|uniref:Uncharacterized protein n=2 Tax=Rhizobium leguminosarum TaxID=384 RepID=A0A154I9Q0_RHILE|nr:hypothetical protein [Rhizobium leguminosarum]KZA97324.1 hypothetical protein A4A59_03915 [Rhizobium leguminosarum]